MSTATAAADTAPPAKGSKKKLIIIIAIAALVLVGGGVAAMLLMKKKAPEGEGGADAEEAAPAAHAVAKHDPKHPPVFVPLEPFTVNLADKDAERYAQLGITLEIQDAKLGDQIKAYMPAIRNHILMAIADRTASELLAREGKEQLAERIKRETCKALGFEVEEDDAHGAAPAAEGKADAGKKKKKKKAAPALPITAVHFSNFIIQ